MAAVQNAWFYRLNNSFNAPLSDMGINTGLGPSPKMGNRCRGEKKPMKHGALKPSMAAIGRARKSKRARRDLILTAILAATASALATSKTTAALGQAATNQRGQAGGGQTSQPNPLLRTRQRGQEIKSVV